LFAAGDGDALAAALERVRHDAALRGRLRIAGPRLALTFNWEEAARRHLELWREVARR
jgi:glycosyltransferase involved in cell wall biosynthesis